MGQSMWMLVKNKEAVRDWGGNEKGLGRKRKRDNMKQ